MKNYEALMNLVIKTIECSSMSEEALDLWFQEAGVKEAIENSYNSISCLPYNLDFWAIVGHEKDFRHQELQSSREPSDEDFTKQENRDEYMLSELDQYFELEQIEEDGN